ncbi:TPA: hypothetical protein ACM32R_000154 [Escherichia coli]|uniref:hypothetical protein n=1 Tax=Citrobacter freundii TaxID=546 RepID=UPI000C774458|nr:hypothetical protein [Citrobacter freundii]NTY48759.1 hypothetical protein [Citrobacter freundii]
MAIVEIKKSNFGYYPDLIGKLLLINNNDTNINKSRLMPPADVFLSTFNDALDSLLFLAEQTTVQKGESDTSLKNAILLMHYATSNYIDGCENIIKSLIINDDKKCGKAVREFRNTIKDYINISTKITNHIKHQHRRVNIIHLEVNDEKSFGYFIEGFIEDGIVGPDPVIHKSGSAAFSLKRMLTNHVYYLFHTAYLLDAILYSNKVIKKYSDGRIDMDDKKIITLLNILYDSVSFVYPDEVELHNPILSKKDSVYKIELKKGKPLRRPIIYRVQAQLSVPLTCKTIMLPYKILP